MSRLYISGGSADEKETFDCKLKFRRLEEQRLRLGDLGMIAAYCVKKLNAHAHIYQSRARRQHRAEGVNITRVTFSL